jgi:hypothetical protein
VPAAPQAFHDDGFPPLACVDGAGDTSGQRAQDSATRGIRIVIRGSEQSAGTGSQNGRACGFLIELALIAGKRLTGGKVGLEGGRGRAVQDRGIVGTTIGAGARRTGRRPE